MKRRVVILTEIISPYRIPLFNALVQEEGIDPYVIFFSDTDPALRQWRVYKEEIRFAYCVLRSWRRRIGRYNALLNRGLNCALRSARPDVIVCGGYSYVASWQALAWAKAHHVPFFLWSESVLQDRRSGHAVVEFLKNQFLRQCDGFVVPGKSAREYLLAQGISAEAIFTAPNAVDNEFFVHAAAVARQNAITKRSELRLPGRYFLFVGRLVREKGVLDLLSAYATLDSETRQKVGLVFVGEGKARHELEMQARSISPGVVRFAGFVHREQLAAYYALAEVLILPTHTDPWGLVVNEAMACGLPVVVSRVAGCTTDLVREHWNGVLVSAGDVPSLSSTMQSLASQPDLLASMGAHSGEHIQKYSPEAWRAGLARAVESAGACMTRVAPTQ
jgi:glycosyltransferase involved in cell wall biosynthesis